MWPLALLGIVLLWGAMGVLGWRGKWGIAVLLTLPFIATMMWIDHSVAGPPIYQDPYGPLLMMIVLGPIAIGWVAFLLFRVGRVVRQRQTVRV